MYLCAVLPILRITKKTSKANQSVELKETFTFYLSKEVRESTDVRESKEKNSDLGDGGSECVQTYIFSWSFFDMKVQIYPVY